MAKEEVKVADILSTENIEDVIKNGAVVTAEIAEAAAKKVAEAKKEQLTKELISIVNKADYTHKRMVLSMKKTKKEANIKVEYLKKYTALVEDLKSGNATLSTTEFQKQATEAKNIAVKALRENDKWYEETCDALDNQYPEARYNWRYDDAIVGR